MRSSCLSARRGYSIRKLLRRAVPPRSCSTWIPSAWFAERYILANAGPGAIIVLHDVGARGRRTAAALDAILPELMARGLEVTTLSDLAGGPDPTGPDPSG